MGALKKARKVILGAIIAFLALFIVFGGYKYVKADIDGYGVTVAKVTDDNGDFDLLANNGTTNYPSFSSTTTNTYSAQITALFPTGTNITNKQIHVVVPVGLLIDQDGTGVNQTTNQLVGGIAKPAADNWVNYGVTLQQGRLYRVKTIADGLDVSNMTVNLTFHRDIRVRPQTLTGAENNFKIIISWEDNGVQKTDTVDIGGITITGNDAAIGFGYTSLDFQYTGIYFDSSANVFTVASGSQLPFKQTVYPRVSSTTQTYVDNSSMDLTVTYTPSGGTPQLDTIHTLSLGSTNDVASNWTLINNGDGTYKLTLTGTPKVVGSWGSGSIFYAMLDLTDSSLQNGDKITLSYSGLESTIYSGVTNTSSTFTTTYTIDNDYDVRLANRAVSVSLTPDSSYGGTLYTGRITNTKGGTSPSQDVNIDMSGSNGITGISPSLMTLPLQSDKTITSINYTLVDGTTGTLTGSWTGNKRGMITLTIADWQAAGLSDTDYLKNINYTMGTIPGNYNINWPADITPPQGQIALYGRWLNDNTTTSQIKVTLSNTDSSGTPITTNLTNTLTTPNAVIQFTTPGTLVQNSGYRYNFTFAAQGGPYSDNDSSGIMHSPVFYIRNESAGDLDMSSIKVSQNATGADITSECIITDMGVINGAHVYKIDTANVTSHGGQDAWIGFVPYYYNDNGSIATNKNFSLTVNYAIQTYINTPSSPKLNYSNMIFVGHNDDPLRAIRQGDGNTLIITDPYGMTDPIETDLVAINNARNSNYYQIIGKTDMISYFEAKPAGADDSQYTNLASSSALPMSDARDVDVRLSITNPSGITLDQGTVLIPIPKKGENWGAYSNNKAFPFTLNLNAPISDPGNAVYDDFEIMYGIVATPSDNGAAINASTTWEAYNPAHAADYNMIKIVCDGLPYIDPGTSDATAIQAANTWSLTTSLSMPFDATIIDGTIDAWTPLYYENITIPGTGPGTGPISGWQAAGPLVGVEARLGELTGQVWVDDNHDGTWGNSENVVDSANNWQAYLFKTSDFNSGDFTADPAAWLSANEDKAAATSMTDSDGRYFMDLLNREESYTLIAVNKDQTKYWYTTTGANMSLSPLVEMDTSQTPNITNHPYATNEAIQAGTHVLMTDGSWDNKGLYDIGLFEKTYTVKYDTNGGTPTAIADKTEVAFSADNLLPAEPTRTGYDFDGWNVTAGGSGSDVQTTTKYADLATNDTTMAITLTAQWREKTNVTIIYQSEDTAKGTVSSAEESLAPVTGEAEGSSATAKPGYTFTNWTDSKGTTVSTTAGFTPGKVDGLNVAETYTAHFKANIYNITYTLNEGTNDSSNPATYTYGVGVDSFKDPTRDGYTFQNWQDTEGKTITNISTTAIGDKTLIANWQANVYDIIYQLDGGTNDESNPDNYTYGVGVDSFAKPTKEGYTFIDWVDKDGNVVTDIPKTATGVKTLIAEWEANVYDITYQLDGGTNDESNPNNYTYGVGVESFKDPTKEGYTFLGWVDEDGNAVTDIAKTATGAKTLIANWQANIYNITYQLEGGTNDKSNPATYTYGVGVASFAKPTRDGYEFLGWIDADGKTITNISATAIGDKMLIAKWKAVVLDTPASIMPSDADKMPVTGTNTLLLTGLMSSLGLGLALLKRGRKL